MQCSCGGATVFHSHIVLTKNKKITWMGKYYKNPIIVERDVCESCGRQEKRFKDAETGKFI